MYSALLKVLHRLGGKTLLERVVETARALSPQQVHVVYGHGGPQVRSALPGLSVHWVEQAARLGTGHAVNQAMVCIPDEALVLVLCGDVPLVRPDTLTQLISIAADEVGILTMIPEDPEGYGRVVRDARGHVAAIVEENDATAAQRAITEANAGTYCAPAHRLRTWLAALQSHNEQKEYYLTDIVAAAVADGVPVHAVEVADPWEVQGINDRAQLAHLERCYQLHRVQRLMQAGLGVAAPTRMDVRGELRFGQDVFVDVNVVFEGQVSLGDGVRIGPNTVIKNACIGPDSEVRAHCVVDEARTGRNCRIGPFAHLRPGVELGDGVVIGNFVELKNACVGQDSKASHLSYLGDTQVGVGVNIGAGTISCNYDGQSKHRTIIEDRVFIGSGVELVAPVTIRKGATIGAGSTISDDAPANELTLARARQTTVPGWRRRKKNPLSESD